MENGSPGLFVQPLTAPACKQTGGCSALGHVHHMPRAFSAGVADFIAPVRSLPTDRLKPVIGETEGRDVDINARHSKSPVVRILTLLPKSAKQADFMPHLPLGQQSAIDASWSPPFPSVRFP